MKNGTWLIIDGKRVGAVRLPDGTVEPVEQAKADPKSSREKGDD